MRRVSLCLTAAIVLTLRAATSAYPQTLNIWPGVAPGSERWTQKEVTVTDTPVGTVILNVVTPTLTAYLPQPGRATGTGVIVAPGGYCVALAIDVEGNDVARRLQERGIAAFVLKYRTLEKTQEGVPTNLDMDQACGYGIADGIRAMKVVRAHAAEWGLSPDRLGFMGFSAGGMVASGVLLQQDAAARPAFAALLYGAPFGVMPAIPAGLPPIFMAWARDDSLAGGSMVRFREALEAAGTRPEVHVYDAGGHGFGMKEQGTSSDRWLDDFFRWLQATGLTTPAPAPH